MTLIAVDAGLLLSLVACNSNHPPPQAPIGQPPPFVQPQIPPGNKITSCEGRRPPKILDGKAACNLILNPVCGSLKNGGKQTFSNSCGACSNDSVASYTYGACPG